jgi:hypothetical protein
MAAEGLITFEELRSKLAMLGEARKTAERELEVLGSRRQEIEALEQDANALLGSYAGQLPEDLDALDPKERYNVYKMLRLKVRAYPDLSLEVSGAFAKGLHVCSLETNPYVVL